MSAAILAGLWLLAAAPTYADASRLFIWSATTDSGSTLFLLGGLHYAVPGIYPFPKEILQAYAQADTLAVELDPDAPGAEMVAELMGRYKRGGSLAKDVPRKVLRELKKVSASYGWRWSDTSTTRPWLVAAMLSGADFDASGYSREHGMDLHFARRAKEDGKRIVELETVREQFDAFNRLPLNVQVFLLEDTLQAVKSGDNSLTLARMLTAWGNGDVPSMTELITHSVSGSGSNHLLDQLFLLRNRRMKDRILSAIQPGERWFVVVGVGHLVGRGSVLELLEACGFRVEQLGLTETDAGIQTDLEIFATQ